MCDFTEKRFLAVLAVARHEHDPASDWDAFADAAWREARAMFCAPDRYAPMDGLAAEQAASAAGAADGLARDRG